MTFTGSVREDIVFLDPVIGVGEVAISDHRSSQPTYEEILSFASDAHVAGLITGKAGILHLHLGYRNCNRPFPRIPAVSGAKSSRRLTPFAARSGLDPGSGPGQASPDSPLS